MAAKQRHTNSGSTTVQLQFEFQVVRERAEMGANSSAEKRPEMAQASMETDEGINAKDLPVTNEVPSLICYLQKLLLNQIPQQL